MRRLYIGGWLAGWTLASAAGATYSTWRIVVSERTFTLLSIVQLTGFALLLIAAGFSLVILLSLAARAEPPVALTPEGITVRQPFAPPQSIEWKDVDRVTRDFAGIRRLRLGMPYVGIWPKDPTIFINKLRLRERWAARLNVRLHLPPFQIPPFLLRTTIKEFLQEIRSISDVPVEV
jgi:hypothetical protein